MDRPIEFTKLSGSGNDFICLDNRDGRFDGLLGSPQRSARFAQALCRRSLGAGADGVIFAGPSEVGDLADISARFFEADGSECELCGNGTACFVKWASTNGFVGSDGAKILTPAGVVLAKGFDDGYVRVCIPLPEDVRTGVTLEVKGESWTCDYVVTGVPHAVIYVDDLEGLDIHHWGPGFRYHPRFQPRGVNANFVQVLAPGEIAVRTWEYGVEGETLACGTGSAASAILAALRFDWPAEYRTEQKPILVHARSGDVLRVYFDQKPDGTIDDVCLETIVRVMYRATLGDDLAQIALGGEVLP